MWCFIWETTNTAQYCISQFLVLAFDNDKKAKHFISETTKLYHDTATEQHEKGLIWKVKSKIKY